MWVRCAAVLDLLAIRSSKTRRIARAKISIFRFPFSLGSATGHLPVRPFYPGYQKGMRVGMCQIIRGMDQFDGGVDLNLRSG